MVHLHEIANYDFLLFSADQPVDQAREAVGRLNPACVIVRLWDGSTAQCFLFTVEKFLRGLTQADGGQPLVDALLLHKSAASPALDAYQDADPITSPCVIMDHDRVIGFHDPGLPPQGMRRGSEQGDVTETSVSHALQADFPEQVTLGQTASLLVSLVREAVQQSALPIAVLIGTHVDIVVQPERGFVLEGTGESSLAVTDEAETLPIQFKLRASGVGPGRFRVLCFQGGRPLGAITLTPTVIAEDQPVGQRASSSLSLAPFPITQPDLTLCVFEQSAYGQRTITLQLLAQNPSLGLYFKRFGPIELRMDPLTYFQDFFRDIEGLRIGTAEERTIAIHKLERKGARLFQDILPEDLRILLWSLREHIGSMQVLSDEPWVPWELLRLQGQEEDGRVGEGPFLCEAFAMTRWFPGIGRRPELHLKRMAVVIPTDSALPYVKDEHAYLRSLADEQRQVTDITATYLDVLAALSRGKHDSWHFTGHGKFVASDPNRSAIQLEHGQLLCAEEICGQVSNCGLARPLVFLNACQTGLGALSLTGIGGWARCFVEAGAAGFVGPMWNVYDHAACKFAQALYDHLLAGKPIGQAAKSARAAIRPFNDPTWLAYTVFADPLATVQ